MSNQRKNRRIQQQKNFQVQIDSEIVLIRWAKKVSKMETTWAQPEFIAYS